MAYCCEGRSVTIRGVYSSIIRPKCWGIFFPLWGRIPSFGRKKKKKKEKKRKFEENIKKEKNVQINQNNMKNKDIKKIL